MPFRIKDIARDLGVSVVTISKVLRNRTGVSDSTRRRVLSRLRQLKYEPNLAAQRPLRAPRRYLAGLVVRTCFILSSRKLEHRFRGP